MFPIHFAHSGKNHVLTAGGSYAEPREVGFRDTPTGDLRDLVADIESGRPWRQAVQERYATAKPWLHRIITDPSRTRFLDALVPPGDGPALDIGAGWGQTCRPLAALRPVVALEPVTERLAFIRAAARQDGTAENLGCLGVDYFDVQFEIGFSLICAIGVLEWVGAFQARVDSQERQRRFLAKIRGDLTAGGTLVLGIENRLGLKYLLGCPDDHIGVPHLACLPAALARQRWTESSGHTLQSFTYSREELEQLLRDAGFGQVEFFAALPDYKLPECIIPLGAAGRTLNAWLATAEPPAEHNGYDGSPLDTSFQLSLRQHYRGLAAQGIAHRFVPSFFVRAS